VRAWEVDWGLALAIAQCVALVLVAGLLAALIARVKANGRIAAFSIAASRKAARASERRARAAEAALYAAQRPWIVAEDLRLLRPDIFTGGRFDAPAEVILRNTGLTPARNVVVRLEPAAIDGAQEVDVLSHARVALFDARLVGGAPAVTRSEATVVVPGEDLACATHLRSRDVELRHIAAGGLSVVGRIDYDDAEGRRHTARFVFDLANRDGAWRFERRRAAGAAD
jgi:hypothetical protein